MQQRGVLHIAPLVIHPAADVCANLMLDITARGVVRCMHWRYLACICEGKEIGQTALKSLVILNTYINRAHA